MFFLLRPYKKKKKIIVYYVLPYRVIKINFRSLIERKKKLEKIIIK